MRKHLYTITLGLLIISWLVYSLHFYNLLEPYASAGIHVRNPALYIATESWGIVCIVVASFLLEKLIKTVWIEEPENK